MRGLVMIDRDILNHPSFADEAFTERDAFIWMICEASYQDRTVRTRKGPLNLARGQLTASTRFMADKWGWKEPRVRRFLKRLKIDAMIDVNTDAVQTVVTVCNYDKYQDFDHYRDAVTTQQKTQWRRSNDAVATQTITPEVIPEETPDVTPARSAPPEGDTLDANGRPTPAARSKPNYIPPSLNRRKLDRQKVVAAVGTVSMIGRNAAPTLVDAWADKGVPLHVIYDKAFDALNTASGMQADTLRDDIAAYIATEIGGAASKPIQDAALMRLIQVRGRHRDWKREWGPKPTEDDPRCVAADGWQSGQPVPEVFFEVRETQMRETQVRGVS